MSKQSSLGVFVCECGNRIAGNLDVPALTEQISQLPNVTWAGHTGYWCSQGSLERMRQVVAKQSLDRVIIAGCAPRTHEAHFRRALANVNPALVNVVNIRDLCALPHQDNLALAKAHDQIAMAVAEVTERRPATPRTAQITPHALVIGGGIAGMTAALGLSDAGISVTLVEREPTLGGLARTVRLDREAAAIAEQCEAAIRARSNIQILTSTQIISVNGPVGRYQITLGNGHTLETGAIIVATGGQPSNFQLPTSNFHSYAFVLCDMTPEKQSTCLHACCVATLRQAAELKRQQADSQVTVFFRELYTAGGTYNELVWEAQRLGVDFVRYPAGQRPQAVKGEITVQDELTGREVRVPCEALIDAAPLAPQQDVRQLAGILRLPVDEAGFLAETRVRIRPADRIERGMYVCGAAHYPCDAHRAAFEAYSAAACAAQHIARKQITSWAPPAVIDAARCNGCGDCVKVCPFMAVTLESRQVDKEKGRQRDKEMPPLAMVDALVCTGCGNCVSVCPVKAAEVPTSYDEQIEAQIYAALRGETSKQGNSHLVTLSPSPSHPLTFSPCHLVFACEWSGYSAAEIAGASGLTYPANTRIIRLNCTGRLQPGLVLKALEMGAAGVLVLGCAPGGCHYEQGNERCAAMFEQASRLAHLMGMGERLKLEWIPPDDGARFVQVITDFCKQ